MIKEVEIKNYKSITSLTVPLGRVTVFIGANGSGKSNVLEAIAIGSAAANDKLDSEFLASRGIRVSDDPRFMRSAFHKQAVDGNLVFSYTDAEGRQLSYSLHKDNDRPYSPWERTDLSALLDVYPAASFPNDDKWRAKFSTAVRERFGTDLANSDGFDNIVSAALVDKFLDRVIGETFSGPAHLKRFLVFSAEYSALRVFEEEGQIQPLGIRGEGLFKLLRVMNASDQTGFQQIRKRLLCLDWFADLEVPGDLVSSERSLRIRDRYLDADLAFFDQKSANEGFLFLLFYFSLFISQDTPPFFAIDNIDASLNPKLCSELMTQLTELAKMRDKQVICTTHNPAVLDGLDLTDDEQRLFVVSRNRDGHTRIKRIPAPTLTPGQSPVRLSEAFLRGYLGGLPDNF
jgi:predicted ATPase